MNNEPVAWAYIKDGEFFDAIHPDEHDKYEGMYTTPVYTHPAKTLTDEEIKELSEKHLDMDWQTGVIEFARAILKKASEK